MVKLYPTTPVGAVTVPGVPIELDDKGKPLGMEVSNERADELMAYYPAAWTTNEDGSPTAEQLAQHEEAFAQAWSEDKPKAAPKKARAPRRRSRSRNRQQPVHAGNDEE